MNNKPSLGFPLVVFLTAACSSTGLPSGLTGTRSIGCSPSVGSGARIPPKSVLDLNWITCSSQTEFAVPAGSAGNLSSSVNRAWFFGIFLFVVNVKAEIYDGPDCQGGFVVGSVVLRRW